MNKIMLLGRLVRDPEVRYTTTGKVGRIMREQPYERAQGACGRPLADPQL